MSYETNENDRTNSEFDDTFFGFYEYATGNIYLRFKEGVTRETPMSPSLEKMKRMIPENYPTNI